MGETALFESMVICEYLDEVHPPSLHPSDPLQKALNRGWIEFSSELFADLYRLYTASEGEEFEERRGELRKKLERLERQLGTGPFFNGGSFAMIDAAIAPAFLRLSLLAEIRPLGLLEDLPKVERWSGALLARDSVRTSVVPEFPVLFREYLAASGSYLARGAAGGRRS